jgi:hypothetical protein
MTNAPQEERQGRTWTWNLRISSGGCSVVSEAEAVPVFTTPFVEKALVTTVPGALGLGQLHQLSELCVARGKDHHPRVENVGPSHVWHSRKLVGEGKEMRELANGEDICVEENDLLILSKSEDMKFCEDGFEIWTT